MNLKFLAISDTHLGEDCSLLSFPHGRQHLWRELRRAFSEKGDLTQPFVVDELVLVGDIVERTLASTSQIITHGNAFVQTLGSAARIRRATYLIGNHERAGIWTEYLGRREGLKPGQLPIPDITGPEGELLVRYGRRCDPNDAGEDILSIFFGYPYGSAWRGIERTGILDFAIANPVYATQFQGRTYVFTHGTHFRPDVVQPEWIKRVIDHLQIDRLIGHLEIDSSCDVRRVAPSQGLLGLEREVTGFVDTLWPNSMNVPTPWTDQLWFLITALRGRLSRHRPSPPDSRVFSRSELAEIPDRIPRLVDEDGAMDGSLRRMAQYFLPHLTQSLHDWGLDPCLPMTLVYGDTHGGGWGQLDGDRSIRVYNTGGWTVGNPKSHPACQVFAVDEHGEEYLLDVSFKDVRVGGDNLLELAGRDAENRR